MKAAPECFHDILLRHPGYDDLPVGGRLAFFSGEWDSLGDTFASSVVRDGLRIGLHGMPWQERISEISMPPIEEAAVWEEVLALLKKRCIRRLQFPQLRPTHRTFVSGIFCVAKKDGGLRPCLNLKPFNEFVTKRHFKLESLATVFQTLQKNDFMAKVDIKDAYLHVPVAKGHQPFLRFNFRRVTYQFLVLCFGLTTAPFIFTRLMKPVIARLRQEGIRLVIYLDDILVMAQSAELLRQHTLRVVELLAQLGWVINWKKSDTAPSQIKTYLGVSIDSVRMSSSLPEDRLRKMETAVQQMLESNRLGRLTIREAAKTLGQMSAAAVGISLARLKERPLMDAVRTALAAGTQWDDPLHLNADTVQACGWWLDQFRQWNGVGLIPGTPSIWLTTDASATAQGCTLRGEGLELRSQFVIPEAQMHRSSNWRELSAILHALQLYAPLLSAKVLLIMSDNTTALACIRNQGSREPVLNAVAAQIWEIAVRHNVRLLVQYIPGANNSEADRLSRWVVHDPTGWQLHPAVFARLVEMWGPLSIDLFASETNHLLPRFFSWIYSDKAEGIDCFRHQWPRAAFAHPTPSLIGRVLEKVKREGVQDLILVAPSWPSAPWWPDIQRLSTAPPFPLQRIRRDCLIPCGGSHPPPAHRQWRLMAWRVSAPTGGHSDCRTTP